MLEIDGSAIVALVFVLLVVVVLFRVTRRKTLERKYLDLVASQTEASRLIGELYNRAVHAKDVDPESAVTVDMIEAFWTQQGEGNAKKIRKALPMGAVVFAIILVIVAICGIGYAVFAKESRWIGAAVGAGCTILAVLVIILASLATVGTSDVGVLTAFGGTRGDLTPGVHFVAPWDSVTTWDGAVQDITYTRSNPLTIHIGGQQTAYLAVTLQYQIRPSAVDSLFKKYRTQPNMQALLVSRSLDQAINDQLSTFNPVTAVAAGNNADSLVPYQAAVLKAMQTDIGSEINVESVFLPFISYDAQTTARLNAYQTQKVDTLIAQEAIQTAIAQSTALKDLQQTTASSPNAIVDQCITNVLEPIVKAGGDPAGIDCWPGGSSPNVVVPTK